MLVNAECFYLSIGSGRDGTARGSALSEEEQPEHCRHGTRLGKTLGNEDFCQTLQTIFVTAVAAHLETK